jgi:hypothetical protein
VERSAVRIFRKDQAAAARRKLQISALRCAPSKIPTWTAATPLKPTEGLDGAPKVFIPLGGLGPWFLCRKTHQLAISKPRIPPLRFAPVGMTRREGWWRGSGCRRFSSLGWTVKAHDLSGMTKGKDVDFLGGGYWERAPVHAQSFPPTLSPGNASDTGSRYHGSPEGTNN